MGTLDGKVGIITGAGRGIGRATALLAAKEGASLVLNDYDPGPAEDIVKEIVDGGGKAVACPGDVTKPDFGEKIVKTALDSFGDLHIIVNNAGYTWDKMVHNMTDEMWYAMIDVHATASFRIIRAAAPHFRSTAKKEIEEGKKVMRKIVNVMSVAGVVGNPGQANYAAAKAAMSGLTKTMAREWGPLNITTNAVAFGFVETRLTDEKEKGTKLFDDKVEVGIPKPMRDMMVNLIPLRRGATPEEGAGAIYFMISPYSDYVNGHVLIVNGGQ